VPAADVPGLACSNSLNTPRPSQSLSRMVKMQVIPGDLASAEEVGTIGSMLEAANAFAALPACHILPAGAVEGLIPSWDS
jgi:hypothetical protein